MAIMLASTSVQAEDNKQDYTTLEGDKYVMGIHDSISGGIISVFNLVKAQDKNNIQYINDPETQAKLAQFKKMINDKLQSDQLTQSFYFKTASATLSTKQINYLQNIVLSLNDHSDLIYTLRGFSDARGDKAYNAQLSLQRINSVAAILRELNVPRGHIQEDNKGESASSEDVGYEEFFFDRRVELIISKK